MADGPTSMHLMTSMNVTVRGLRESVFRKFKARAVEEGMKLGDAVTQAMDMWIKQRRSKPRLNLLDLEPFDWGKGTKKVSLQIDQILYGERS